MTSGNRRRGLTAVCVASSLAAAGQAASAQSRSASGVVGVTNSAVSGYIGGLNSFNSPDGVAGTASAVQSFTGLDAAGTTREMTFSGSITASAQYGVLHSTASGTVTNTYYNAANPIYYNSSSNMVNPNGSPDGLASLGFADFSDVLQYGGILQAGYQAKYVFHVDGTNSGYGTLADLSVQIGGGSTESFFDGDTGPFATDWVTQDYPVNGQTPQTVNVQFSDQFVVNTADVADGSTESGSSDFSDTVTLAAIDITDAAGDPVSGVTVTSASGTSYPVPEPTTLGLAAAAATVFLGRRRRHGGKRRPTPRPQ